MVLSIDKLLGAYSMLCSDERNCKVKVITQIFDISGKPKYY